jgi:hypothetical protein
MRRNATGKCEISNGLHEAALFFGLSEINLYHGFSDFVSLRPIKLGTHKFTRQTPCLLVSDNAVLHTVAGTYQAVR